MMRHALKFVMLFSLTFFFCVVPCSATITRVQYTSGVDITTSGSSVTIASTAVHNTLVVLLGFRSSQTPTVSSITDAGGDTFVAFSSALSTSTADTRSIQIWYCLNLSATQTAIVVNLSTNTTVAVTTLEYHSTLGVMYADVGSGLVNQTTDVNKKIATTVTTTGTDFLVTYEQSRTATGVSIAAPYTLIGGSYDGHGNLIAEDIGQAAGSVTGTFTTDTASAAAECSAVSFRDTAPSSSARHSMTLTGVGR